MHRLSLFFFFFFFNDPPPTEIYPLSLHDALPICIAGDDVDVCWRLQQRGWTLGFSPAAMVWHHRRNSVRAYWRQQKNYAKAEALLEKKWPEKYNRSEEHTSELQSHSDLVCRLLLE